MRFISNIIGSTEVLISPRCLLTPLHFLFGNSLLVKPLVHIPLANALVLHYFLGILAYSRLRLHLAVSCYVIGINRLLPLSGFFLGGAQQTVLSSELTCQIPSSSWEAIKGLVILDLSAAPHRLGIILLEA